MGWQFDPRRAAAALALATVSAAVPLTAGCGGDDSSASASAHVPAANVDRFDAQAAYELVREQVELGPRPAGSQPSRVLAARLRRTLPNGRFQPIGGGLRNVVGRIPGRNPKRVVIVSAHYDTKEIPGFVGAVDGASGTAIAAQLARTIKPRELRPTVVFLMFDGEEAPAGKPDDQFARYGIRGSKAAAPRYKNAEAMILLDFVGNKGLRIPREDYSDKHLWQRLRAAARTVGVGKVFPAPDLGGGIQDDHIPFIEQGVPSIDLIDFDFPCWHRTCDDLSKVSTRSLDASGETVYELLRRL
jgi:Zn-dependent M28 family amino/carboxypeptidase